MPLSARPLLATAALALLAACQPQAPAGEAGSALRQFGTIAFKPCVLTNRQGLPAVEALCGNLPVAEDPTLPQGRQIALNIAWLPAHNQQGGTPDPVFFLAGGPGQAATEVAAQVDMGLREVRRLRDVILIDQRGTGRSNPLDCRDERGRTLKLDEAAPTDEVEMLAHVEQCLRSLDGRADPRFYTTGDAVRDLEAVRAALGVEKINLMGGSYGTRVAQQYAMAHPQRTRSVVLDGVAPNRLVVGGEFARTLEESLQRQDRQCAQQPACKARFGDDLIARLHRLKARLQATPVEVTYHDPATHAARHDRLDADTLTGLVQGVSYLPQLSALLPLVVSESEQGRHEPLMAISRVWSSQVGEQLNRGMQWSVICAEDAPRFRADPADSQTVLGADMARLFFTACRRWPRGEVAADFTQPYAVDVPTLLLSGELDPVTPPRFGEEVAKPLRNARHLTLRGQGHGTMAVGCVPKLLGQFLESADPKALEAGCLDSLNYVPPFTGFNGWEP